MHLSDETEVKHGFHCVWQRTLEERHSSIGRVFFCIGRLFPVFAEFFYIGRVYRPQSCRQYDVSRFCDTMLH